MNEYMQYREQNGDGIGAMERRHPQDQYAGLRTPAYIFDEHTLRATAERLDRLSKDAGARILYAVKACPAKPVLEAVAPFVAGFACSSLNEAVFAGSIAGKHQGVSFTSAAIPPREMPSLRKLCSSFSFNSISEFYRHATSLDSRISRGLRVNPELPLAMDIRYDPCRPYSRLGAPLSDLSRPSQQTQDVLSEVEGLHVHSNCDSMDPGELEQTVRHLSLAIPDLLTQVSWLNLGGGYLWHAIDDETAFCRSIWSLKKQFELDVFIEPGASFVREAVQTVATVLDIIDVQNKKIAVLDTTVNHMPEVFEYQAPPDVFGDAVEGEHEYMLAGRSCLAGDVFGEYGFGEPLDVGSKVAFLNAGAYTLAKANIFNGISLPNMYWRHENGSVELVREPSYEEFALMIGENASASV
jgi:carboxynorspermidine decarboxylase